MQALDLELLIELLDGLRANALDTPELLDFYRRLFTQILQFLDLAGLKKLLDLVRHVLTDAWQVHELVLSREFGDIFTHTLQGLGSHPIRTRLPLNLFDLQKISHLLKQSRDQFVLHRDFAISLISFVVVACVGDLSSLYLKKRGNLKA